MKQFTLVAALAFVVPATAQVTDGSFEAGIGAGTWTEASVNYGTPLCDAASCGTCGGPCVALTGAFYAWFGGAGDASEIGSVEQSVFIPSGNAATLIMGVKIAATGDGTAGNYLKVFVDGVEIGMITAEDSASFADYQMVGVSIDEYADGGMHTVKIEGKENGGTTFNVLVDDVSLEVDGLPIGLFENEALAGVQTYLDATQNMINVRFNAMKGAATVSIVNMNGATISTQSFAEVAQRTLSLSADELSNGVYIVNVEQNGKRYAERIVVAK